VGIDNNPNATALSLYVSLLLAIVDTRRSDITSVYGHAGFSAQKDLIGYL
jgi:hypothetical protein